ncbi:DUF2859 domain-containing protein [Pseudohalioglobus lutimaris]|jgi:integrating conjugative element protein (TIGR03765 family)|uniref:Integrating conjugative element protein n=1 Tax=Pseudohalioglobus lutimaris TaxID=1737061 RepID=A0A2N5WZY9_9GAMM|nr:DUF2859 domain-containing protein [Pseudohalioglobus lutimaris]PLW67778.1 hypothetical protein C0039_15280 [Pseudohalioglobus lutimaris]
MQLNQCSLWIALLFIPGVTHADSPLPRHQPTVVFDGRSTISAKPYYQRIEAGKGSTHQISAPKESMVIASIEDRLPITPTHIQVGTPDMKVVDGLVTPLFVMGMDDVSLRWFKEAAPGLESLGARGIVIEASNKSDWIDLKDSAAAAGIDLMLMEGDSLAQGYGVRFYPVVLVGPDVAGQGVHE